MMELKKLETILGKKQRFSLESENDIEEMTKKRV